MAPFMGVGRSAVVVVLMIEQHERMYVVRGARHVCTRALARLRIDVHPAFFRSNRERAGVIGAEHLNRCQERLPRRFDRKRRVGLDERRIDIVVAEIIDAEHTSAKLEVPMQHVDTIVGDVNQCAVNLRR